MEGLLPVRPVQRGTGAARRLYGFSSKTDATALPCRRVHQLSDGRGHGGDGVVVVAELLLDACFELVGGPRRRARSLVRDQEFA